MRSQEAHDFKRESSCAHLISTVVVVEPAVSYDAALRLPLSAVRCPKEEGAKEETDLVAMQYSKKKQNGKKVAVKEKATIYTYLEGEGLCGCLFTECC